VLSGRIYRLLENYPEYGSIMLLECVGKISTRLHGIIFQNIELQLVTDLRVFTLTARYLFSEHVAQAFVLCPIPV